jgi:hypothetical protein
VATALQGQFGNAGLADAVRGEGPSSPTGILAVETLADASVGVPPGAEGPLSASNAARQRAMRRATAAASGGLSAQEPVARAVQGGEVPSPPSSGRADGAVPG